MPAAHATVHHPVAAMPSRRGRGSEVLWRTAGMLVLLAFAVQGLSTSAKRL